jgi:hypothetical protein
VEKGKPPWFAQNPGIDVVAIGDSAGIGGYAAIDSSYPPSSSRSSPSVSSTTTTISHDHLFNL